VAGEVFAERGTQASLDDIASRAGVGNATLYRHFPTRDALLVATLRYRLGELDRTADTLADREDAGAALEEWFFHVATHLRTWRGLPDCIAEALSDHGSPLNTACQPLEVATERLLSRARSAGHTRETLDPHDVFTLVASLAWAADKRTDTDDDLRRMIRIVLGGIERPHP
jgi:AcrR family transcriptional regulator